MTETKGDGAVATWSEIEVANLGGLSGEEADSLLAALSRRVSVPVRQVEIAVVPPAATVPGRRQLDADLLLARLEKAGSAHRPLVAVTGDDLALPIFTFVFGRARLGGAAALVSAHRLRPEFYGLDGDPELVTRRTVAEILHELGHVAGLEHCTEPECLMRFAASVEAADLRGERFCDSCRELAPTELRGEPARPAREL